jgi:hypothetical protein
MAVPGVPERVISGAKRPETFSVGNREFDPTKVGYRTDPTPEAFVYRVGDDAGRPIQVNSNSGHDYGVDLNEAQRLSLVEYLKTL